jgi:hypothetical protein
MGSPHKEKELSGRLREIVSEPKQKYIMYKVGIEKDWDKLSKLYLNNMTFEKADAKFKTEEDVQVALRYAMKVLHQDKLFKLYDIYFERAKEDTQAFRAFIEFSNSFFADEKESELMSLLSEVNLDE